MTSILQTLYDAIQEDFGRPARLSRLLGENGGECRIQLQPPRRGIGCGGVVRWHELGQPHYSQWPRRERGTLMGWTVRGGNDYGSFTVQRSELGAIGLCEVVEDWSCEINEVEGLSASKSSLENFDSMDEWIKFHRPRQVDAITPQKLEENMLHGEVRIIHAPGVDHFARYSWDGRIFLMNHGGSHHFAAARYIAARLPKRINLRGSLYKYSLNAQAIASLRQDFEMFVIPSAGAIAAGLRLAMEGFKATWLWQTMPRPFESTRAVLLPRAERRSRRAAAELRKFGVADLGQQLDALLETQDRGPKP